MTDPTNPRDDDCDRPYIKPIGYLAAYELGRLLSGHDGHLRSAKFGPSPLDADVPVYLNLPTGQPKPAALEAAQEMYKLLLMIQEAAIDLRGEDFNLTTEQWAKFHSVMSMASSAI